MTICLSAFALMAQAPTKLNVKLLNNHFQKVVLSSAYGSSVTSYANADIKDDQFTMTVSLPNDIYKFDFGNGSTMLLVITPGETVDMTLDAENLQQIVSVSGSETMGYVKQMAYLAMHRKEAVDSINAELAKDPDKIYWSDFAQRFNLYRQTNDDVDNYLLDGFGDVDTIYSTFTRSLVNGKLKGAAVEECADVANRKLKKLEINYNPFANYQENVSRYYDFSGKRPDGFADFFRVFDQYESDLHARHQVALNSLGTLMPKVKELLAEKDSLVRGWHDVNLFFMKGRRC